MGPFDVPELELAPERVAELLRAGCIQLVDVREPYEWEAGRIDGARHIELERLAGQTETIDRDRPVVFACRLGRRSAMAAQAFHASGYDAYTMAGGMVAWVQHGLAIVPVQGRVADH